MTSMASTLLKSENMYAQLVEIYPTDPRFLKQYAEILNKLDKPTHAEKIYERLHALLISQGDTQAAQDLEKKHPHINATETTTTDNSHSTGFLSFLGTGLINRLVLKLKQRSLKEDEYLFHFGDEGQSMFIVIEGTLAAILPAENTEKPVLLNLLKRGDIVGEMAMLQSSPRSADVIAANNCKVFELERKSLISLINDHKELETSMLKEAETRHCITQISRNKTLATLPLKERRALAHIAKPIVAKFQHRIAEGGSLIQSVFLVTKGVADVVYDNHRGESNWLHHIQAGDMIGMNAILDNPVHAADIMASTDVCMLELPLNRLQDYVAAYPRMRLQLEQLIETDTSKIMVMVKRLKPFQDIQ